MTRDQYKKMRETEVENLKKEAEQKRNDTSLTPKERDRFEAEYQALCQQQEEWARGGFWTANEDTAYNLNYLQYHDVKGSYKYSGRN